MSARPGLARRTARGCGSDAPRRPWPAALPYLSLVPVAFAVAGGGLLGWRFAVLLAAAATAAGLMRALVEYTHLTRERARADSWIRLHPRGHPASEAVSRRISELVAPPTRRMLAGSFRGAVKAARKPPVVSASPLNYSAVRAHAEDVERLADRLADLDRNVNSHGVILALELLTSGASPLYDREQSSELPAAVLRILDSLRETR